VSNRVEFIALDAQRQDIPYVKLTMGDGTVREFRKPGVTDEMLAKGTRRTMDCTDCHNRPSHSFAASAERAANEALALGQVPRSLPFARRELVKALKTEALAAIETSLRGFYSGAEVTTKPAAPEVDRAVTVAKALYSTNVFPQMKITWGSYRNELGHIDSPGCFRCHDEEKATPDGRKISQDCESCHRMR
jgi:hypothetical protein